MKKILSMILALAMILSLGVTAFAADGSATTDNKTDGDNNWSDGFTKGDIAVGATYTEGASATEPEAVYSVKISWTVSNPTYTGGQDSYKWNTTDLQYDKTTGSGSWANGSATVTVANRSDAAVSAAVAFADGTDDITAMATWTYSLNNADFADYSEAVSVPSAAVNGGTAINYTEVDKTGEEQKVVFRGDIIVNGAEIISDNVDNIGTITVTLTTPTT